MGLTTEATPIVVTPVSVPTAEPIASVLQPLLSKGQGAYGDGDGAADAEAFFERLRELAMQWHDPFYSGNNKDETVLVSFEIDHDSMKIEFMSQYTTCVTVCKSFSLALLLLFMLGPFWKDDMVFASVTFMILFCLGHLLLLFQCECTYTDLPTKGVLLAQRRHVAIGRDGIYLDDADQKNRNLVRRQVIPFAAIATCRIVEVGCLHPSYRVVITTNQYRGGGAGGSKVLQAEYAIRGLCKAQAFVDVIQMAIALNANSHSTVIV